MAKTKTKKSKPLTHLVAPLLMCALICLAMLSLLWLFYSNRAGTFGDVIVTVENKLLDFRFLSRGQLEPSNRIGVLGLDEKSIQAFGRWPFSRSVYQKAFSNLKDLGVEWVGFDVVWDKPERASIADALSSLEPVYKSKKSIDDKEWRHLNGMISDSPADRSLVEMIQSFEKIVLGYIYYKALDDKDLAALGNDPLGSVESMEPSAIVSVIFPDGYDLSHYPSLSVAGLIANTPTLSQASPHFGFFNNDSEDSVTRWVSLVKSMKGQLFPSLSLKMAASMTGKEIVVVMDKIGVEEIMLVNPEDDKDVLSVPVDRIGEGRMLLNHLGGFETIPTFSLLDAYNNSFSDEQKAKLKGMSLVMGPTAIAINDVRANPFDSVFNGVEHHAAAVDNMVSHRHLKRSEGVFQTELMILAGSGILIALLLTFLNGLWSAVLVVGLAVGYFYFDREYWFSKGVWVYMSLLYLQLVVMFVAVTLFKYVFEEREKRKVKDAFQHYLSADVMDQVLDDPDKLKLGGERREVTVFFSDVRGFTTISESLPPEKLVELMNDYLSPMTSLVLKSGGVLDKYIGDAIMAFWGAPVERSDQADVGVQVVLAMLEALERLRVDFPKNDFTVNYIGCALNKGVVSVCNIGFQERF
jgi:adenylate cyclase